jgi:Lrp/AsnC family transcriptional regulator
MGKLDDFDRKILRLLQRDADISVEDLGEKVGLSRNACWRRVRRLREDGVITRTVALVDPDALDLRLASFIMIRAGRHDAEWLARFHRAVQDIPEIVGVYRTSGDIDYVLYARIPDMAAYDAVYQRLISKIDLTDVSASFVMEEIKHTTELPVPPA